MSTHDGHTSNLRSGNPNAPLHMARQGGGRGSVMIVGMAAVAAGLYGFWRLQFTTQDRSHASADPAEMPTWQFRHAQQAPEFNERMSSPGGTGTNLHPRGHSAQELPGAKRGLEAGGANERGGESHPSKEGTVKAKSKGGENDVDIVGSVMTALHGHPSQGTQNENGYVGEPAEPRRMNDRGGIYTKNTDYKDGYRRD
ncbi:hypothetical protein BD414DRAFT_422823 [Trametes punicea]|nr:hypothetical protein BD414DRAFT_422823 [Trametes punicea]